MATVLAHAEVMDFYRRSAVRVERLLRGTRQPPDTPIPHMAWTIGDVAAHLVIVARAYLDLARGKPSPVERLTDVNEVNARLLAGMPERDLATLAGQFADTASQAANAFDSLAGDEPMRWHAGIIASADAIVTTAAAEYLIHGWDMSSALGRAWPINPADARLVLYGLTEFLPATVDRHAARGFTATYELRIRGGERFLLRFVDGDLTVERSTPGAAADCRLSVEPVSFLMIGYGRGSQVWPALTGKMIAWGRKPWLAARFTKVLRPP